MKEALTVKNLDLIKAMTNELELFTSSTHSQIALLKTAISDLKSNLNKKELELGAACSQLVETGELMEVNRYAYVGRIIRAETARLKLTKWPKNSICEINFHGHVQLSSGGDSKLTANHTLLITEE